MNDPPSSLAFRRAAHAWLTTRRPRRLDYIPGHGPHRRRTDCRCTAHEAERIARGDTCYVTPAELDRIRAHNWAVLEFRQRGPSAWISQGEHRRRPDPPPRKRPGRPPSLTPEDVDAVERIARSSIRGADEDTIAAVIADLYQRLYSGDHGPLDKLARLASDKIRKRLQRDRRTDLIHKAKRAESLTELDAQSLYNHEGVTRPHFF